MITHPVALYLGFTGFSVPFAFAMAALLVGRTGDEWITITRRWSIIAWYFLSLGLLIGGWWSYHVLGWGGYWAWDPVENAAFMPWLTGTAFLHSVMIQERRRMLRLWNLALVILTFSLTLFGTFLTRSGVIASVHAFTQGAIGVFFLSFLALVVLTALALIAWRWDDLGAQGELDSIVSRESAFLLNNVLFVAAAFTVFFGTVFPLLSEAARGVKVSVGAPFFNQVNVPLFLSLIFLMGVGPLIAWRRASLDNLKRNFVWPVAAGAVAALTLRVVGVRPVLAVTTLALTVFVAATITVDLLRATRARRAVGERALTALGGLLLRHNRRYGGFVVHLAVLVVAVGVTGSQAWSVHTETTLQRGEQAELGGYRVRFDGLRESQESNHGKVTGTFTIVGGRGAGQVLEPAKKFYPQEQSPIAYVDYRLGFVVSAGLLRGSPAAGAGLARLPRPRRGRPRRRHPGPRRRRADVHPRLPPELRQRPRPRGQGLRRLRRLRRAGDVLHRPRRPHSRQARRRGHRRDLSRHRGAVAAMTRVLTGSPRVRRRLALPSRVGDARVDVVGAALEGGRQAGPRRARAPGGRLDGVARQLAVGHDAAGAGHRHAIGLRLLGDADHRRVRRDLLHQVFDERA